MTVTATTARSGPFTPNGSTTAFPFTFVAASAAEVEAGRLSSAGVFTALSGYTVSLNSNGTGTVNFSVGPTAGDPVYIRSKPSFEQQVGFVNQGAWSPASLDAALDRSAIRDIYLKQRIDDGDSNTADLSLLLDDEITARTEAEAGLAAALSAAVLEASEGPIPELKVKTPFMFGALGHGVDDTAALQAFFDDARDPDKAATYIYDWRGSWLVSDTIWAVYWDGVEPNVERRFIMGTLRVAPLVNLPGGAPLANAALEIVGLKMSWLGSCGIHPSGTTEYGASYYARRYTYGVRARFVNSSCFGTFHIDDAIREAFWLNSEESAGFTAHGVSVPTANCIGTTIEGVWARNCGSNYRTSEATPLVPSSRVQGGVVSGNPYDGTDVFGAGTGSAGSNYQATQLTVPSTADLRVYDMIWGRVELTPTIYGTIAAADNGDGTGTITWSAGDPTAFNGASAGLAADDVYPVFQSGPNAGREFRVIGFGGTSNRVVTVAPAPTAHAATSDPSYQQFGRKNWHVVQRVVDPTHVNLFPWVANRINSSFHIVHGAAWRVTGNDCANVTIGTVYALSTAVGAYVRALYAPKIGTLLCENGCIGARLSDPVDDNCNGLQIEHGHASITDGCDVPIYLGSPNVYGSISLQSAFTLGDCETSNPRLGVNDQRAYPSPLGFLTVALLGVIRENPTQFSNEGMNWDSYGISNAERFRQVYAHSNSTTLAVTFDRDEARLFAKHHWAEIMWTGPSGAAPTGTLTLNLDPTLAASGWTFAGAASGTTYAITAPSKNLTLKLQFITATKKVAVTRLNGA